MAWPAFIVRRFGETRYRSRIAKGLSNAYDRAETRTVEQSALRAVIFCDLHRGSARRRRRLPALRGAYCAALGWYLEHGYELWLLGDVEELWENRPEHVVPRYADAAGARARVRAPRLRRFFGNHDMDWRRRRPSSASSASTWPARSARGLRLTVTDAGQPLGTLFLVHGHQGTVDSGNLLVVPFSRLRGPLRLGARCSARSGLANTSPADDAVLRGKHDRAMAAWATAASPRHRRDPIAGHTHRPVFPGNRPRPTEATPRGARALQQATGAKRRQPRAELELPRAALARRSPTGRPPTARPCYFNTGCSCFRDRDITCLELDGAGDGPARPLARRRRRREPPRARRVRPRGGLRRRHRRAARRLTCVPFGA